jgi:prepilin-type processing-associated H-X9-DG protein
MPDLLGDGLLAAYTVAASSQHPGGANFAFVDGSVRVMDRGWVGLRYDR